MTDHIGYRDILIGANGNSNAASARTAFYAMNLEHSMAETNGEMDHARNVDVYGLKKEGSTPILWIKDSADINIFGTAGGYTAVQTAAQYPADFRPYPPSLYRIERTSPMRLSIEMPGGPGAQGRPGATTSRAAPTDTAASEPSGVERGVVGTETAGPKCSYPLDDGQLQSVYFPKQDWGDLIRSLWAPWCGYSFQGTTLLLEADGPATTIVAAEHPGTFMRGYANPTNCSHGSGCDLTSDAGSQAQR